MTAHLTTRHARVREILLERRRELQDQVRARIRDGRTDQSPRVGDQLDHSDADSRGDMELALIQMGAETLTRIDSAIKRLEAGAYGSCAECGKHIAERRLRALPFAVRCQGCEERREEAHGDARRIAQQRGTPTLFSDVIGS